MENFTLPVPNGTTNHGNPNLICTPVSWSDMFIFFATNYFAHAFTVKQLPGEEFMDYIWAVLSAVFYPYYGLPRGIESILRRPIFSSGNELQMACRAGALCVVVRSNAWTPSQGQSPVKGVYLHGNEKNKVNPPESGDISLAQPEDVELGMVGTLE